VLLVYSLRPADRRSTTVRSVVYCQLLTVQRLAKFADAVLELGVEGRLDLGTTAWYDQRG
jgi:hypothetical protein